jgi:DNA-binding YbaB/EbfC family protein
MNTNPLGDLVRQAGRMKKDMERVHEELKSRYVDASAGGGLVEAVFNGKQELVKIRIDPKAVAAGQDGQVDIALLEDLISAAVSQGLEMSRSLMKEEMRKTTGGLGLEGMLPELF